MKKKGRHAYTPSDDDRRAVRSARAHNAAHADIATAIGVSVPTLRKYFADELKAPASSPGLFIQDEPQPSDPPRRPHLARGKSSGRPRRERTQSEADKVATWSAAGLTVDEIAAAINASAPWVRKTYAPEIAVGPAQKKAALIARMEKTAMAGNVTAQRALLDIYNKAELAKLQDSLGQPLMPTQKPEMERQEPAGKKEAAQQDAKDVLADSDWAAVLPPAPVAH